MLRDRLRDLYPNTSGRRLKQWLEAGRIRVNDVVVRRADVAIGSGDRVVLGAPPPAPFPASLRLVHEDDTVIVVDKPPGVLTIATEHERERTVYRLLRDWLEANGAGRVFVVHRLDRETSGLVVFARTVATKRWLQHQFEARSPERLYVALVEGTVHAPTGTLTSRLAEDRGLRVRPTADRRRGKEAISHYRVLERYRDATMLEVRLHTGRRGQIRAQLAALGYPIVGDRAYGARRDPLRRVALHATRLGFDRPDGRRVVFESAPPPGFRRGGAAGLAR